MGIPECSKFLYPVHVLKTKVKITTNNYSQLLALLVYSVVEVMGPTKISQYFKKNMALRLLNLEYKISIRNPTLRKNQTYLSKYMMRIVSLKALP